MWIHRHPVIRWTALILKLLSGVLVLAIGIIMAMPGVPGPGFLVILIGVMLLDSPGKRRLERRLISRLARIRSQARRTAASPRP